MDLKKFGDKYGDAALAIYEGYQGGARMAEDKYDRGIRRQREDVRFGREGEAYERNKVLQGRQDEAFDRSKVIRGREDEEFGRSEKNRKMQADGAKALKALDTGDMNAVKAFYDEHIPDNKTGEFTLDADGSIRLDYTDDVTGKAGTEVFAKDQLQGLFTGIARSDANLLSNMDAMRAAAAKARAEAEVAKTKFGYDEKLIEAKGRTTKSGSSPAQVQTIEWMAKNLTGGDMAKAYKLAQMSKTNPQELAAKMYLAERKTIAEGSSDNPESEDETWSRVRGAVSRLQDEYQGGLIESKKQGVSGKDKKPEPVGAPTPPPPFKPGMVRGGFKHIPGKDPNDKNSWVPVDAATPPKKAANKPVGIASKLRPREEVDAQRLAASPEGIAARAAAHPVQVESDIAQSPGVDPAAAQRMGSRFGIPEGATKEERGLAYGKMAKAQTRVQRDVDEGKIPELDDLKGAYKFASDKQDRKLMKLIEDIFDEHYAEK